MRNLVTVLAATSMLAACSNSGSSGTSSTSTTFAGTGFKATSDALKTVKNIVPASAHSLSRNVGSLSAGSASLIWDTSWIQDPRCSGGGSPHCGQSMGMKGYLALIVDPGATYDNGAYLSVFGRIDKALQTACAFSSALYGANGELPAAGTHTITFDTATFAKLESCNFTADEKASLSGQSLSVDVAATTNTTRYDRKMTMNMGGQVMTTYVRITSAVVNVLATELQGTQASKTIVSLDRSTGLVRAEYISRSSSADGEMHRIYMDPVAARAYVAGASYSVTAPLIRGWGLVGVPGAPSSQVAVSVMFKNEAGLSGVDAGASSTSTIYHYKGCMDQSTGALATADTLSCSGSITGVDLSTNYESVVTTMMSAVSSTGAGLVGTNAASETSDVPFTSGAQVFTAAVPHGP